MTKFLRVTLAGPLVLTAFTSTLSMADEVGVSKSYKGPTGLQLYSLRHDYLRKVRRQRSTGPRASALSTSKPPTSADGRRPSSRSNWTVADWSPLAGTIPSTSSAMTSDRSSPTPRLGLTYAGCAWIPHTDPFDEKQCREAASVFNKACAALAKEGIKFYYHNHGYEFRPHGQGRSSTCWPPRPTPRPSSSRWMFSGPSCPDRTRHNFWNISLPLDHGPPEGSEEGRSHR